MLYIAFKHIISVILLENKDTFYFPFSAMFVLVFRIGGLYSSGIKGIQRLIFPKYLFLVSSIQFSHSVVPNSLQHHGLQHTRPPCPSPTPGVYTNSCPLRCWWHPTISSSVIPLSSWLQSFPASGSLQMSQLFTSGGQSIGVSASASVLPTDIQGCFPLGLTGWISLQSKGH